MGATDSSDSFPFPGTLRAPTLYLSLMSARQGDSLLLQCSVFSQAPATRVIFCKDGEEVLFQMGSEEKITYVYNHTVSSDSSGNYACGYEIKDKNNRVIKSQLSPVKHLSVTCESGLDLKLLLGITIPAVLVLAVVLYLLGKKGNVSTPLITLSNCLSAMSLPRNQRSVHEVAVAFSRLLGRARQQGRPRLGGLAGKLQATTAPERRDTDIRGHQSAAGQMSLMLHLLKCRTQCAAASQNLPKSEATVGAVQLGSGDPSLRPHLDNAVCPK
ncbi:uncharacterized protein LOC120395108 isoform X2 [Mauremys reevesii]|uniref:uncharacterized protein LOC120395108 isoform X2 n=1 Tax=Mauremys reevesii TaxID=260615 RepID=UPI00193EF16F|nr:uncharacterized protein LOC120395108 isoform X2 [Mauremys reevesii]